MLCGSLFALVSAVLFACLALRAELRVALYVVGLALIGLGLIGVGALLPARPSDVPIAVFAAGCALAAIFAPEPSRLDREV